MVGGRHRSGWPMYQPKRFAGAWVCERCEVGSNLYQPSTNLIPTDHLPEPVRAAANQAKPGHEKARARRARFRVGKWQAID